MIPALKDKICEEGFSISCTKYSVPPVTDSFNKIISGVGIIEDKTSEHKTMQQAEFFSLHDPQTMLPNRNPSKFIPVAEESNIIVEIGR